MHTSAFSPSADLNLNPSLEPFAGDPDLTRPLTLADMKPLGGLIFDPGPGRWTVAPGIREAVAYVPDHQGTVDTLLALDDPTEEHNPFRSRANAITACGRLVRFAECPHGDEARAYYVRCGQKTLCRCCGTGKALTDQLRHENPELYAVVNDSQQHQVDTFTLDLGSEPDSPEDNAGRLWLAKQLWSKLIGHLKRTVTTPFGAKMFLIVDPHNSRIGFRALWIDLPYSLARMRALWELVCRRYMAEAFEPTARVYRSQHDRGEAYRSLPVLLSGLHPLLMLPPPERVRYATPLFGMQLGSTVGLLRGQSLEDAAEGLVFTEFPEDVIAPHGECSTHHTPLAMTQHTCTIAELEEKVAKVWIGPIRGNRVKPHLGAYRGHLDAPAMGASPPC